MGSAIYIQSIQGYGGNYEERAEKLKKAGFVCLREVKRTDGLWKWIEQKYWEIWYLADPMFAKGPIKGIKTVEEVRQWVSYEISPGNISIEGDRWGLCID